MLVSFCDLGAALPEIGGDDLLVLSNLSCGADGDRLAVVEHLDPLTHAEDDAHVVFDEEHAAAEVVPDARDRRVRRSRTRRAPGTSRRPGTCARGRSWPGARASSWSLATPRAGRGRP